MNLTTLKDRKKTGKEIKTESWNGLGLGSVQISGIQTLGIEGSEASHSALYWTLTETTVALIGHILNVCISIPQRGE